MTPSFSSSKYNRLVTFLIIKPTRCTDFSNLFSERNSTCFGQFLCPSSGVYTAHTTMVYVIQVCRQLASRIRMELHHREFFTAHTAMAYVIQVCWQLVSGIRMEHPNPARKLSANLYDIYHCCVYSEKLLMMDRGTVRNKQSFNPKINLRY